MSNSITVDEAIKKGHKLVTYPSIVIIIIILVTAFTLAILNIFSFWIIGFAFVLAFVLPWLYWGFRITKWRIWAFDGVRNVHELQRRAVEENLIWEEGHLFESLEIRNTSDKLKWKALQEKFFENDIFSDDFSLPTTTEIFNSKRKNFILISLSLVSFTIGMTAILGRVDLIFGGILLVLSGVLSFFIFRTTKKKEPKLILNELGIQTSSTKTYKWSDIKNEAIVDEGTYRLSQSYLIFDHPNGSEKIFLNDLAIEKRNLENLLRVYRGRSNFDDKEKAISAFFRTNR